MKRESTVVWLHVSSFVVSSEQLEKKIQEAAREKIQNERKCDKKNKKQRKQHLSLTGRKHILKIKIKIKSGNRDTIMSCVRNYK